MRVRSLPFCSRRFLILAGVLLTATLTGFRTIPGGGVAAAQIPAQLSDAEFWKLSTSLSEPDGVFRSDNLLSNELTFQYVIPELVGTAPPGGVYMGVGPEQNFTYIAALKPPMAFIVDIRHGNLDLHLLYKALFELSDDRAEFVSRLFSLRKPDGLTAKSTAYELFTAYSKAEPSQEIFDSTLKTVVDHLKAKHGFPLSDGDLDGIEWALYNYYRFGPWIYYNSSSGTTAPAIVGVSGPMRGGRGFSGTTYADLMTADDGAGVERSYLATEERFAFLKDLQRRNLLVPVVGDFGGQKAIREVGKYLRSIDAVVAAFYLSNVEQYLSQDGKTASFLANVAALPLNESSRFIRSGGNRGGFGGVLGSELGYMMEESRFYAGK